MPVVLEGAAVRPGSSVDGAGPPPGPDFIGDEGKKRGEQPEHHIQRREQRAVGGGGKLGALIAVPPPLDQLEIVIAERPEKGLGPLEHPRVVVLFEVGGRLAYDLCERREQALVDRGRHWTVRLGVGEYELRRIEEL